MRKQYSILIIPISIIVHLLIINTCFYYYNKEIFFTSWQIIYINISWLILSYFTDIYNFTRYTKVPKILKQLFYQFIIFSLFYFTYYALADINLNARRQVKYLVSIFLGIVLFRAIYLYALRKYRLEGYNFRNVVIIGEGQGVNNLTDFFDTRKDFGYRYKGYFSDKKSKNNNYLGKIQECFNFIVKNNIDEIYCSTTSLTTDQVKRFIIFADKNVKIIKFVPDSKDLFNKMKLEYYGFVPVLSIRKLPFENPLIRAYKRLFDIAFSLTVILAVLSWLTPILFILVKLESKGNLFFSQTREGLKGKPFKCYKYRSMGINSQADKIQATKNDTRVTKIGAILRKTSIDELPQFFNVFLGDMSVVGPRPHMISQSDLFRGIVDKYMVRHFVKPGVTGLAQVKGCRGEIVTDTDIINRVKYDIFYIENWSFFLDLKIIYLTIKNAIKGEEKAY